MHIDRISALEARIANVEKTNRRLLMACAALVALPLLVLACGKGSVPSADLIRAERFEVVDSGGKTRGIIFVDKDGAGISLDDGDGKPRIALAASKARPGLEIFDTSGKSQVSLTAEKEGAAIALADVGGKPRATLGIFKDETWLAFFSKAGDVSYQVPKSE